MYYLLSMNMSREISFQSLAAFVHCEKNHLKISIRHNGKVKVSLVSRGDIVSKHKSVQQK